MDDVTDEEQYSILSACATYYCRKFGRMDIVDDVTQDLAEAMLKGCKNYKILRKRAISAIVSKMYNRQYIGDNSNKPYTFLDIDTRREFFPLPYNPLHSIISRLYVEQLVSCLTPIEYNYIKLWANGYTHAEIAKMYNVRRRSITKRINIALTRMRNAGGYSNVSTISKATK